MTREPERRSAAPQLLAGALLILGLAACAAPLEPTAPDPAAGAAAADDTAAAFGDLGAGMVSGDPGPGIPVVDPATVLQDDWVHLPLHGATDYRIAYLDGRLAIRAEPRLSASGLIRRIAIDPDRCPHFAWSWRVEQLQPGADLRLKQTDDVAASILLLFGDPGFLSDPMPVPTLRYVWTNERLAQGAVIDSPYMPGMVRSLVVENGGARLGAWVTEQRNIVEDYWQAFGRAPGAPVAAVVLFTDNDQTGEPALAYYGTARALCGE